MDEQPALGTILFHVALLTIIVILVDERLMRGALAILPAMLLAQRAIGATQAKSTGEWTGVHDRRMDLHVREHVTKLLGRFRDFYAMIHLLLVKSRVVCKSERKLLDASVRLPWRPPSVREA